MSTSPTRDRAIGIFSRGIARIPHIAQVLDHPVVLNPPPGDPRIRAVAGWGRKPSGQRAAEYARANGLSCLFLEDGFLRSVRLGVHGCPPLSIVVDDLGIYFDATCASRLETILAEDDLPEALTVHATAMLGKILADNLSKYNHAPDLVASPVDGPTRDRVLLIDQTANDQSIRYGLADPQSFYALFDAAHAENPGARILIKTHPDVIAGKRTSALAFARRYQGITWLTEDVAPLSLLKRVDRVYTVTSQMGFEALMAGKPVTCFGMPFYAGWGITDDRASCERRRRRRSVEEIFAAAYILYPRYIDPLTGARCDIERVVDHLALQRRRASSLRGRIYCLGFSFWKQGYVRPFVEGPGVHVRFVRNAAQAERLGFDGSSRLLAWGIRASRAADELSRRHGVPVWRMEDGFIRSVGLGSDFTRPWSLVVDRYGIYFDPSTQSDLERILNETEFGPELIERARKVRQRICEQRITKYNIDDDAPLALPSHPGIRTILVPGQVEDDASILRGAGSIRTNAALLDAVRAAHPDAFIVYKPHPDLIARNRRGAATLEAPLAGQADHVELRHSIVSCIEAVDEVHTMTSLSGFDALLRGKRVVNYGAPFYAGWGLTEDHLRVPRRTRLLTLDELVAGTLLLYPRYWDERAGCHVELEDILDRIVACRSRSTGSSGAPGSRTYLRRKLDKWYAWGLALRCALRR